MNTALVSYLMGKARESIDPDNIMGDSYCYDASEALWQALNKIGIETALIEGAVRDESHTYLVMDDGTILDPTLDQFYRGGRGNGAGDWLAPVWAERDDLPGENPWFGEAAIIPVDHPFARHYESHRPDGVDSDGYAVWIERPEWMDLVPAQTAWDLAHPSEPLDSPVYA